MATRSLIGVMHGDVCKAIYCHWDGYLAYNGRILFNHYDSAKANHLVSLGDVSSLCEEIGEKHPFSANDLTEEMRNMTLEQYNAKFGNMTTFYGRDRGETGVDFKTHHTYECLINRAHNVYAEFVYIMKDGQWYYAEIGRDEKYLPELKLITAEMFTKESVA